jgi:hypothetical protein
MAKVLSLDIGITTGFVYGEGRDYSLGEAATPVKDERQVFEVAKAIESAIQSFPVIDLCIIEGYAYGSGFFNYMQPEITGQVKRFLWDSKIPYVSIPANSMRLAVLGNGGATKMAVRKHLIKSFSVPAKQSPHVYDAFLGFVFLQMYFTNRLSKEHHAAVEHSIVGGRK